MYSIRINKALDLVEVELGGMMSTDEVVSYIAELKHQFLVRKLRSYVMIIDVSKCPIQSQDMIASMGRHMATMPKARSLAIVTGSSLARMQVRRLFTQPYARVTATTDEGRAWVLDGIEPAS